MLQEDLYTEFKLSFNEDTIVTLAAFANAKGGTVYVGMKDDATPCGVSLGPETVQHWINEIKQKTEPAIIPDVEVVQMDGKQVVKLYVQEFPVKPVSARGRYYRRQANSNHQLTAVEIADLSLQTRNSSWDYYCSVDKSIGDIDMEKVRQAIVQIRRRNEGSLIDEPLEFLKKFELVDENQHITNACYLLFCKGNVMQTSIQMGLFADEITIKDDQDTSADILTQVADVMRFVRKHVNKALVISDSQTENIPRWDYPMDAVREIVLNMIVHRDYRSASDSIVKIFPNYMQFYNPGSLPDTISIEQLMNNQYVSTPRNRQIARMFKELGEIEKYGTGIRRVCAMCETYGCKRPKWEAISDGVRVTLYGLGFDELGKDDEKLGENVGMLGKKLGKDDEMLGNELGEKRMEILKAIADDSKISTKQLAERFGMSSSAMDRHLKYLKDNGFLRHVGPKNGGCWQVIENKDNSNKEK